MASRIREYLRGKICYLTCSGRLDGAGAQAHAIISVMIAAEYLGFKYVHTPMVKVDHNDQNIKKEKWIQKWNNFFNFGESEFTIEDYKLLKGTKKEVHRIKLEELLKLTNSALSKTLISGHIYMVKKAHSITHKYFDDQRMKDLYQNVLAKLSQRYHSTPKPELKFYNNINVIQVAVHIRRGDVANGNVVITKKRFMQNNYFYNIMLQMEKLFIENNVNYQFHIFSEGTLNSDFSELYWIDKSKNQAQFTTNNKLNFLKPVNVHLSGDPITDIHHLISADILVMAKSCYSYVAGLLNPKSVKIYTKFWFKPGFENWIIADENSSFNLEKFKTELNSKSLNDSRVRANTNP